MRIVDLLNPCAIELKTAAPDKAAAIDKLVALHEKAGDLTDAAAYKEAILAREAQGTTAIGEGIAVPHAKCDAVKQPSLSAMTVPGGVDYSAPDGKPSDLLFMIAAPMDGDVHLEILARLMTMLMDADFTAALRAAETPEQFLAVIDKAEKEKYDEKPAEAPAKTGYRILAVTACPTGIAHTYMAAEALEKAGEKLGYALKAETDGSGGVKNRLTREEIEAADGIIVAADKNVEMARFDGKRVLKTSVSSGINKPEELVNKIMDGSVPVYHHEGGSSEAAYSEEKESFGRQIYKHLMNGVSHMLPFVVGGGVLIALGFLIDTIAGTPAGPTLGYTNPVAAIVFWIGKAAFALMLPVLAAYIAQSIADRPGLLPGFVGGVFASSGYTFGSLLENQNLVGDGTAVSGFLGALIAGFVAGIYFGRDGDIDGEGLISQGLHFAHSTSKVFQLWINRNIDGTQTAGIGYGRSQLRSAQMLHATLHNRMTDPKELCHFCLNHSEKPPLIFDYFNKTYGCILSSDPASSNVTLYKKQPFHSRQDCIFYPLAFSVKISVTCRQVPATSIL